MTQTTNIHHRVAIMVDGDTIVPAHSAWILQEGQRLGQIALARTYGDMSAKSGWRDADGVEAVHSDAAMLLIAIDAVEFALTDVFDTIILATDARDMSHLARRLRGYGMQVVGLGGPDVPSAFRDMCTVFKQFPALAG